MTIKTQTREVGPLSMRAAFRPGSVNVEKRTAEVVWTTGARVRRDTWMDGSFDEELSLDPKHVRLDRLNNGAPLLDSHRSNAQIGVVESARLDGAQGIAIVRFSKRAEAEAVFQDVIDGVIQNISVGYRVHKFEKVEGGDSAIPVLRAIDWQPFELSTVSMGADDGAGFRSAEAAQKNSCSFLSRNTESNEMTPEQIAEQKRQEEAALAARELEITARVQKLERERQSGITAAFRSFGKGLSDARAAKLAEFCTGDTAIETARAYVLEELAAESDASPNTGSGIERGEDDTEKFRRGISDAMLQRVEAVRNAIALKLPGFEKMGDGGQFRGMRLSDIARVCAERNGHNIRGVYDMDRILGFALESRNGYATPSDFPVLFEDIARKSMDAGYQTQAETWQRFVSVTNVADFKDSSRFQKGSFGGLPVVPPGAEYKNIAIPDGAKMVINTETRGGIIALGREAIVNDDLGFLTNVAAEFGGSAAASIELAAYAFLNANANITRNGVTDAFFSAAFANVSTGAALSGAALSLDRAHMRRQTDISGNKTLDLMPRILMVPLALEDAAKSINNDQFEQLTANTHAKNNQQRGMFSDIITKPLAPVLTGTKRYLFTEDKGAILCVFGPGGNGPTLSSQDGFRRDGVEYKVRIDFKINAGDPKKALYNAGA